MLLGMASGSSTTTSTLTLTTHRWKEEAFILSRSLTQVRHGWDHGAWDGDWDGDWDRRMPLQVSSLREGSVR